MECFFNVLTESAVADSAFLIFASFEFAAARRIKGKCSNPATSLVSTAAAYLRFMSFPAVAIFRSFGAAAFAIMLRIFIDEVTADIGALEEPLSRLVESIFKFFSEGIEQGAFRKMSSRHFFQSLLGTLFFHYAANLSAPVIGVEDVFEEGAANWRAKEVWRLISEGVLADPSARES